ncbi:1-aminocyclopropane-1-carboxylate [Hibiscus syriacus]|uniref:1-aminocyclopropane-1-carboxylate n=1 Tax=Hibiscus syriacus TaxID=106335 RepID=A0A6A2WYU7_HIBSY|nr:1-aminocyclopropane-1-carboxylate [Hibiscus syriacus]
MKSMIAALGLQVQQRLPVLTGFSHSCLSSAAIHARAVSSVSSLSSKLKKWNNGGRLPRRLVVGFGASFWAPFMNMEGNNKSFMASARLKSTVEQSFMFKFCCLNARAVSSVFSLSSKLKKWINGGNSKSFMASGRLKSTVEQVHFSIFNNSSFIDLASFWAPFMNMTGNSKSFMASARLKSTFEQISNSWCEHCKKPSHMIDQCWKLHEKPVDWQPTQSRFQKEAHIASQDDSSSSFSKKQIEELQQILSSMTIQPINVAYTASSIQWIIDSGASDHMTGNIDLLEEYSESSLPTSIKIAYGSLTTVKGSGSVTLNKNLLLHNVLYVPRLACNLLSVSKLIKDSGCNVVFGTGGCIFQAQGSKRVIGSARLGKGLYTLRERKNRHLLEVTRSLMFAANAPKYLWGETLLTSTYLINRMPRESYKEFQLVQTNISLRPILYLPITISPQPGSTIPIHSEGDGNNLNNSDKLPSSLSHHSSPCKTPSTTTKNAPNNDPETITPKPKQLSVYSRRRKAAAEEISQPSMCQEPDLDLFTAETKGNNGSQEVTAVDLNGFPIVIRKGVRKCTAHPINKNISIPEWKKAVEEEIKALQKNKTWSLTDLPERKRAVGCRWIFTVKYHSDESVERYKARLVAKVAVNMDWKLHQLDIKNAFLNGNLEEESPRAWFDRFAKAMTHNGFKQSQAYHTLFRKITPSGKITLLIVYVDDMIITGSNIEEIEKLKMDLAKEFETKDLGSMRYFLGMEIARSEEGLVINQCKYVLDLLAETGMLNCKPIETPMEPGLKFCRKRTGNPVNKETYQRGWGGELIDRRSVSGYCTYVWGNLVTWRSKKQAIVSRSSVESKFRAMTLGICEGMWIKRLLTELDLDYKKNFEIFSDSQSAMSIVKNPVQHDRMKHIEIDKYFIYEKINNGVAKLQYIPTKKQLANIFTKALPRVTFDELSFKLDINPLASQALQNVDWPEQFPFKDEDFQRFDAFDLNDKHIVQISDFHSSNTAFAIAALTKYYSEVFRPSNTPGVSILDMCSSWVSHFPKGYKQERIAGMGMNEDELKRNPVLTEYVVQDLNLNPKLPFEENSFDVITNVRCVGFLSQWIGYNELFKPMLWTKAISIWTSTGDTDHVLIVGSYFHYAGGFEPPQAVDISPNPGRSDPIPTVFVAAEEVLRLGFLEGTASNDVDPYEYHHCHNENYVGFPPSFLRVPGRVRQVRTSRVHKCVAQPQIVGASSSTTTPITTSSFLSLLTKPCNPVVKDSSFSSATTLKRYGSVKNIVVSALENKRFNAKELSKLARNLLSEGQGFIFGLESGEELVEEFGSIPDWLKDMAAADDPLLYWLPLSGTDFCPRFYSSDNDETLFSQVEENKDNGSKEVKEKIEVGYKLWSTFKAVALANEIHQLCLEKGVNPLQVMSLIEPWKAEDETASVLISHLSSDDEDELAWLSQVLCPIVLPKLLVLAEPASRLILILTIGHCKLHQRAAVHGIVKECLHPPHVSAFFRTLLCGGKEERRFVLLPCHELLVSNELDSVDRLVYRVREMAERFSKFLKQLKLHSTERAFKGANPSLTVTDSRIRHIFDKGVVIQEIKNPEVRLWSEKTQKENRDSLQGSYVSKLVSYASISLKLERAYIKLIKSQPFKSALAKVAGVDERWVTDRARCKGSGEGITWLHIKQLMKDHPDEWKAIDLFALGLYGLIIFPKTLGYIDAAVVELFEQLSKRVIPTPTILAETFQSLNHCRRAGGGASKEKWMKVFTHLQDQDITWKAPWLFLSDVLFRCGDSNTMTLLGLWGAVGYASFLALRQYGARQFVPTTCGLARSEFEYHGDNYKKMIKEAVDSWKKVFWMDVVAAKNMLTTDYVEWRRLRKNDNIPVLDCEDTRTLEEHLRPVFSELEIAKKEFEAVNNELKQRVKELEAERYQWKLNVDSQKDRADKLEKEQKKVCFELEDLRNEYQDKVNDKSKLKVASEYWKDEAHSLKRKIQMADLEKQHERDGKTIAELETIVDGFKKKVSELQIVLFDGGLQWRFRWEQAQQRVKARDAVIRDFLDQVQKAARHLHGLAREAGMVRQGIQPVTDEDRRLVNLLEAVRGLENLVRMYL